MNIEEVRTHCLQKEGVTEALPFDDDILVYKVLEKIFVLCSLNTLPERINLKCDPEKAIELREQYAYVLPGYHMNKKHWNTVFIEDVATSTQLLQWIDESYELVVKGLPKKDQIRLKKEKSSLL